MHTSLRRVLLCEVFAGTVCGVRKGKAPLDRRRGGDLVAATEVTPKTWDPGLRSFFSEITYLVWLPGTTRSKEEKKRKKAK